MERTGDRDAGANGEERRNERRPRCDAPRYTAPLTAPTSAPTTGNQATDAAMSRSPMTEHGDAREERDARDEAARAGPRLHAHARPHSWKVATSTTDTAASFTMRHRDQCTASLTETQVELDQRRQVQPLQQPTVPGLGAPM